MRRMLLPSVGFYAQAAVHIGRAATSARIGRLTNKGLVEGSHRLRRSLERVGVRFEIAGTEELAAVGGPFVFVANHMSALETQILPSVLQSAAPCTFIVKGSLLRIPVFGLVLRGFDPIVVGRTDPRADLAHVLKGGTQRLNAGVSVIVFPQGSRSPTLDPKTFNTIGMRLARHAGVALVPIALRTEAWEQGRLMKDIGWIVPERPVRFAIGTPIPPTVEGREAHRQSLAFITGYLEAWARLDSQSAMPIR